MAVNEITTDRLLLRRWRPSDFTPFASMNADPQVMEFYPTLLTQQQTHQLITKFEEHFNEQGFGPWAVELRETGAFLGYIGMVIPRFKTRFTPCVEIGWRLNSSYWGQGLATEGARAVLHRAFTTLAIPQVVSFTVPANVRSLRVMEKLGMSRNPADDFDHPNLPERHPLRPHVLYRANAPQQKKAGS